MGTMRNTLIAVCRVVLLGVLLGVSSGCLEYDRTSTLGPSSSGVAALLGNWTSSNVVPSASSCSDFKWDVTQQTGNTASGTLQRHVRRGPQGRGLGEWNIERVCRDVGRTGNGLRSGTALVRD